MGLETVLQHLGEESHVMGAVVPPIFQNSLFVHESCEAWMKANDLTDPRCNGYNYSRVGNPNLSLVEQKVAALENCEKAKAFSSGMAAITAAIMSTVESGSHVVCIDSVYGPTRSFLTNYLPKFGVTSSFVDGTNVDAMLSAIRPETSLVYLESPSSLVFQLQDLAAITQHCRERGIATAIDTTYSAGILMRPGDLGVDLICHTASKYFGGHSDVVGGFIAASGDRIDRMMNREYELLGGVMAPFTAWLILRGMRTLKCRLDSVARSANKVADWLKHHPKVESILHVSDPDFPQAELYRNQMSGNGGCSVSCQRFRSGIAFSASWTV